MARTPVWKSIASALTTDIAEGRHAQGDRLPTEAQLSARFGVNRHTVRRALADMADQGLVVSRRGAGVFVAGAPTDYPLGRRVRFHQSIRAGGRIPGRKALAITTQAAARKEAAALQIPIGAPVHVYDGLSYVDGVAIAVFCSIFPADRFARLPEILTERGSVTNALRDCGVRDYTRASTRIAARLATPSQARHLGLRDGAPILHSEGINVDTDGVPVEYGQSWFSGDRVTFTLSDED
ncbi:MAG: phosphonate metabolism transcriptional regulator PhnF [Marinibacterium sp.]|nr:phosphonate metabolism transcriptional regulator PhnF [Marinibacterium sp.]